MSAPTVNLRRIVPLTKRGIYFTATVVTADGSDLFDGEPCEPGTGATVTTGWLDPAYSVTETFENRADVRPTVWEPADGNPVRWLADTLADRMTVGTDSHCDGCTTIYSASEYLAPGQISRTGLAAHPYGFTAPEVTRALALIADRQRTR